MGLVIAQIQYSLPVFAGQLTVSYINRIDALFAKRFKWRLTTNLFKAVDIFEHSNKQLFCTILRSYHYLKELLPHMKYYFSRNRRGKVMVWNYC